MNLKVLIVDDEPLAREAVRLRIQNHPEFAACREADNGLDALVLVRQWQPDVVFLDIEMPGLDGLAVARHLISEPQVHVVFVTAYNHYAVQAFRLDALDYLVKPIRDDQFREVVRKTIQRVNQRTALEERERLANLLRDLQQRDGQATGPVATPSHVTRIALTHQQETVMVNAAQIESIVSDKDYLRIRTADQVYYHRSTMKEMQSLLDENLFLRCHRSHLVNLRHLTRTQRRDGHWILVNRSGDLHPVSRRYRASVRQQLRERWHQVEEIAPDDAPK
ncbi:Response regulator transcription factor [Sulfidibacter corallicola]|uniref:Response regulator transcription factor n=1 Tax=Sulfidibacter corallicola TaxID=2818388 RepID=A0A8A4TJ35_SULCO|nr:LytTR family DNA-binding domain-containing protein [Sulfidibacter corallicola]QTD48861.1 response regulator transcription factor [Sulfidibacter corallicola]